MNIESAIHDCVNKATAGLCVDPELRAEVRTELVSHLLDAMQACRIQGMSEEESAKSALLDFGPPEEVADALLSVNRARMSHRALIRFALRWAAVPAALVLAVGVTVFMVQRLQRVARGFRDLSSVYPLQAESHRWRELDSRGVASRDAATELDPAQAFYFHGDDSRETPHEQQRAIWEAHPANKLYYANYISALCSLSDLSDLDSVRSQLEHARHIDPENARYDYILAYALAGAACSLPRGAAELIIHDRQLLDQAMAVLQRGHDKPRYRRYALEMLTKRLAILPPVRRTEELVERVHYVSSQYQPDTYMLKHLARIASAYADVLVDDGRLDQAVALSDTWRHFIRRLNDDAFAYMDMLAVRDIADTVRLHASSRHAFLRTPWLETAAAVVSAVERGGPALQSGRVPRMADVQQHGSVFARLMTPRSDAPPHPPMVAVPYRGEAVTAAQSGVVVPASVRASDGRRLAHTRWAEHVFMEQLAVALAALGLAVMMVASALTAWRHRRAMAAQDADCLVLPSRSRWCEAIGIGVLVPLVAYVLYSRGSALSGREFGVSYLGARFALELALLGVTLVGLYALLTARAVRERCSAVGLDVPPRANGTTIIVCFCLAFLWGLCLSWRGATSPMPPQHLAVAVAVPIIVMAFVLACGWLRGVLSRPRFAAYHGVAARARLPHYAVAIVLLALVVHPLLLHEEARHLRHERLFEWRATDGFANTEYRRVLEISDEVRRILKGLGA